MSRLNVTKIGAYAFENFTSLETIVIPKTVTSIGKNAFIGCTNLKYVTFEDCDENITIDNNAFNGCPLKSVYIGRNIINFSGSNYLNFLKSKSTLEEVTISEKIKVINDIPFEGCTRLTKVTFKSTSESLILVGDAELFFKDCPLRNVYIGRKIVRTDNRVIDIFKGKHSLESITISEHIEAIRDETGRRCRGQFPK